MAQRISDDMEHARTASIARSSATPSPLPTPSPLVRPNPFDTPAVNSRESSRPSSFREKSSLNFKLFPPAAHRPQQNAYFHSRRVQKELLDDPAQFRAKQKLSFLQRRPWVLPALGALLGVAFTGYLVYSGLQEQNLDGKFCPVLSEDFSSGTLNPNIWTVEQQVDMYGNGEFDQTTDESDVLFIKDGVLNIKPKLQDENLVTTMNATVDLGAKCTGSDFSSCYAATNTTNGTIVPPVKSARINTKKGASIKYGKVEVRAKMPKGDWMWPAIWMLPTDDTYGAWPASGEIDIAELRGNNHTYMSGKGGNNIVSSALHWGPNAQYDSYLQTYNHLEGQHQEFSDSWHTYGMVWSDKRIYTYVDNVLLQVMYIPFNQPFWPRGGYPAVDVNRTAIVNPWSQTGRVNTPFDQKFYMILNVAIGSTNGWFQDSVGGKPWADGSPIARKQFWDARSQWLPSWEKNGVFQIKSVKMWERC